MKFYRHNLLILVHLAWLLFDRQLFKLIKFYLVNSSGQSQQYYRIVNCDPKVVLTATTILQL